MKSDTPQNKPGILFIGTGVMGAPMAAHFMRAGYPLTVFSRTSAKTKGLQEAGAHLTSSIPEGLKNASIVCTMVGTPEDVRQIYFGPGGILMNAAADTLVIDFTTSEPLIAAEIAQAAEKRGLKALDAPVSGGQKGAIEARLSLMVGGNPEHFHEAEPIFACLGNPRWQGKAGSGQYAKLCNQIAIASTMVGVCESIIVAIKSGLDPWKLIESMSIGAAGSWSLNNLAPKMLKRDFNPGFFVKHFIKDMKIAQNTVRALKLKTPGLDLALSLFQQLDSMGGGGLGTQALFKVYFDE